MFEGGLWAPCWVSGCGTCEVFEAEIMASSLVAWVLIWVEFEEVAGISRLVFVFVCARHPFGF